MTVTRRHLIAARNLLRWSQTELAQKAGVSEEIVADFESSEVEPSEGTISSFRKSLEEAGIEFADDQVTLRNEKAGP